MYGYMDKLDGEAKLRYKCKLDAVGLTECPYNSPADSWINNPTQWPEVQWPDIFSYLVDTPGVYTKETMKNFRSLEAHNTFVSGWVQTIYHKEQSGCVVLKADVRPSWRVNENPHVPWAAIKNDGTVLTAHCNCMAGLGESCSHVGALLFKIEAAVRHGYTRLACTDKPCEWNKCFVKSVEAAPVAEIKFYKSTSKERIKKSKRKVKSELSPATADEQQAFLRDLASSKAKRVGLHLFKETADVFISKEAVTSTRLPKKMQLLYNVTNEQLNDADLNKKCNEVLTNNSISKEESEFLCSSTVAQASCPLWHEYRTGRVTASVAHSILHTSMETPAPSLVQKICHPASNQLSVPAIKWGREMEPVAYDQYKQVIITQHDNCQVTKTGLRLCEDQPHIGASPDGLVTCTCCGDGVVEIKCPYKYRDLGSDEMVKQPDSCLTEQLQLKTGHQYYSQVQLQMFVFQRTYCHFVLWTKESCIITTVSLDEDYARNMVDNLDRFWKQHCLPELLTHKSLKGQTLSASHDSQLFCYCQEPDDGSRQMIGCDSVSCKYMWFHFDCINLKRAPKGKWYCVDCKQIMKQ